MARLWFITTFVVVSISYGDAKLRLVPGPDRGRLEVLHAGTWGTICDDDFDQWAAAVACRELGLNTKYSLPWKTKPGYGTIWLDDLDCVGHETSLSECLHKGWGITNCFHNEDVGVFCSSELSEQEFVLLSLSLAVMSLIMI